MPARVRIVIRDAADCIRFNGHYWIPTNPIRCDICGEQATRRTGGQERGEVRDG